MRISSNRILTLAGPVVLFGLFLGAWQAMVAIRDIPRLLLPPPTEIASAAWADRERLIGYAVNTAIEALAGLLVAVVVATVIAVLVYSSPGLASAVRSASGAGRALPAVVLFPILTLFMGTSDKVVHVIVAIAILPFFLVYALSGLQQETKLDDVIRVSGGSRFQSFRLVHLPISIPYFMTGLRTCLPLAIITAIIAEYFGGSTETLGAFIKLESKFLHTVNVWSAIVYACLLGITAFAVGTALEKAVQRRGGRQPTTH